MNKKMAMLLALVGVCLLSGSCVVAQTAAGQKPATSGQTASDADIQLLRKDIRSEKKQLIAANLILTDTEATKFWPVYDRYQAGYKKIGDAEFALINEYAQNWGSVTDEQALNYLKRAEEIKESVLQLRKKYVPLVNSGIAGEEDSNILSAGTPNRNVGGCTGGIGGSAGAEPREVRGRAKV